MIIHTLHLKQAGWNRQPSMVCAQGPSIGSSHVRQSELFNW